MALRIRITLQKFQKYADLCCYCEDSLSCLLVYSLDFCAGNGGGHVGLLPHYLQHLGTVCQWYLKNPPGAHLPLSPC